MCFGPSKTLLHTAGAGGCYLCHVCHWYFSSSLNLTIKKLAQRAVGPLNKELLILCSLEHLSF